MLGTAAPAEFAPVDGLALGCVAFAPVGPKPLETQMTLVSSCDICGRDIQCNGERVRLCLFYPANFFLSLCLGFCLVPTVPVDVLVLLPSPGWRIDTVAEVVLQGHLACCEEDIFCRAHFSVLVCGNVGPLEFSLTPSSSTTNRLKHCQGLQSTTGHGAPSCLSISDSISDENDISICECGV